MDKYPHFKIGELCNIIKGETGIANATPGEYPLVNTGAERKTCNTYQFDTEAVCIPLVSSTGHGKKTLNYVHYQRGRFALGTILAAVIPKEPQKLSASFLQRYLQFYKDKIIVPLMKGAANVSLAIKDIAKIEVPLPPINRQKSFIELFNKLNDSNIKLQSEFLNQSNYLTILRQTILQEAIEGKLTADWRKKNPELISGEHHASKLLEKIRAEKEQLIKEGKIKKEKRLPPINNEEKLFDLPQGWVLCRLGSITNFIDYRGKTPNKIKEGIRLITAKNVKKGFLSLQPEEYISEKEYKLRMTRGYPCINDIFFTTEAPLGNACLNTLDEPFSIGQRIITVHPYLINASYLLNAILSNVIQKEINKRKTGLTAKGIKSRRLVEVPIPLSPIKEQQAIVDRVDKLMNIIDELEKQVTERKDKSERLMQSVLREAFSK